MNLYPLGIAFLMGTTALHAEWKVATVHVMNLFDQTPEVIAAREEVEKRKQSIKENPRYKALEDKRAELKQLNIDGGKILMAYQALKVKDEKGPEADRVREYRAQRKQAESHLEQLKQEVQEFEKEQLTLINQEMTVKYRAILNRLTAAVQKQAAARGFDIVYDISGNTHVGLPTILYIKEGTYTDLTDEMKKLIVDGKIE